MLVASGCEKRELVSTLDNVEGFIESRPDSALKVLRTIDPTALTSKCQKARYSLLYSMALDKNWVDLSTDSIIAPAVMWYQNHGKKDYRMKMHYYRAVISINAGNNVDALNWFSKGERFTEQSNDLIAAGRYLLKQAVLFGDSYNFEKALSYSSRAKLKYETASDARGFASATLGVSMYSAILGDVQTAKENLEEIRLIWADINDYRKCAYYRQMINLSLENDTALAYDLAVDHGHYSFCKGPLMRTC